MTRDVTDMLRDACSDLEHAIVRGDVAACQVAHSDVSALVQDVAQLEADVARLRKALRAVSKERDEWKERAHAAGCDEHLGALLAGSIEAG